MAPVTACVAICNISVAGVKESFPSFLPREVENIRDPYARDMARRIERIPVQTNISRNAIMSSCVKPLQRRELEPVILLHGFDSSCLEWRYTYPLLESAGLEAWAFDILGWGFSDLELPTPCDVSAKRKHLYQFWRTYIKRPAILVGPSLGAATAIDFATNHPEAVSKLILIDASVYAEGLGNLTTLPKAVVRAGASILKSVPLRFYGITLTFKNKSLQTTVDMMNVGRLHCLQPWWEHATVDFMLSGGYNVVAQIPKIEQPTLIIWGMEDNILEKGLAEKLQKDLSNSVLHQIPDCGHLPHIDNPEAVTKLILDFI